ncbi:MAG: hypothetical protein IKZ13_06715 [Akkermansia sp.]|nr:hypothetical protein [Akkermansia sp.]
MPTALCNPLSHPLPIMILAALTFKSISICAGLMIAGGIGALLIAMLNDDTTHRFKHGNNSGSINSDFGLEELIEFDNFSDFLLFLCGGLIVGPILYLLPISLPSGVYFPLILIFSMLLYAFLKRWLKRQRLKWAEEDKARRRKQSSKRKSKNKRK